MKRITEVAVKIFALYFFVKFIGATSSIVSLLSTVMVGGNEYGRNGILSIGFVMCLNLIISVLLWQLSGKIAILIAGDEDAECLVRIDLNYNEILKVSVKVLGLILVIMALEEAVYSIVKVIGINMSVFDIRQSFIMLLNLLFPFIKIGIGMLLVANSKLQEIIGIEN